MHLRAIPSTARELHRKAPDCVRASDSILMEEPFPARFYPMLTQAWSFLGLRLPVTGAYSFCGCPVSSTHYAGSSSSRVTAWKLACPYKELVTGIIVGISLMTRR